MVAVAGAEKFWVSLKEFIKRSNVSYFPKTRTSRFPVIHLLSQESPAEHLTIATKRYEDVSNVDKAKPTNFFC